MKKLAFWAALLSSLQLPAQTVVSVGASDTTVVSVLVDSNEVKNDVKEALSSLKIAMEEMKNEWNELDEDERETIFSVIDGGSKIRLSSLIGSFTALIVILVVFGLPALIVFLIIYFIYKNRQNRYKVMEAAYAAGKEVPQSARNELKIDYMRHGIKKVALGIGLVLLFWFMSGSLFLTSIGFLIICIGAGEIVCGMLDKKKDDYNKNDETDNNSTPSADSVNP